MKPKRYIMNFYDLIHKMDMAGLIDEPDIFAAISDIEIAVHKLEQAFDSDIQGDQRKQS